MLGVSRIHDLVVPDVTARAHLALGPLGGDHDDVLERIEVAHDDVDGLLDRGDRALARGTVDGDQRLRLGELHPLADGLGREAAEDDVVRRTDARTGEHRDDDLRDHRQVDPDDVALLDAEVGERVGEALDVGQDVGIGERALRAILAEPVEGHPVATSSFHVAVKTVVRDVQLAADEPLVEGRVGVVEDGVPLLEPVEFFGLLYPPPLPVALGLFIDRRVVQQRVLAELGRRRKPLNIEERR